MSSGRLSSDREPVFDFVNVSLAILALLAILYPLYFVVIASFSDPVKVSTGRVLLWINGFTIQGYERIFNANAIWLGYKNTIIYSTVFCGISLFVQLPVAYALSRREFMIRNWVMLLLTVTMFFSGGLIPTYLLVRSLGMLDTMWALVLPTSASVWHIIIARTYFSSTVPQELVDAATMDGCSVFRFFTNIVLPLSKAIIAVLALYSIVGQWNQYFHALIYIYRHELMPLQMVLRDILLKSAQLERQGEMESQEAAQIAESIKYGSIIVSTLPVLVLYPFLQKYFVRGVMIGALKG